MTTDPSENLFRRNAIRALDSRRAGRPIAFVPRPWLWLAAFCICFLCVACAFAWRTQYARKESVRGWLVSERGVARITHPASARVLDVFLRAGEEVREGDVIARVSAEQTLEDGSLPLQAIVGLLHDELAGIDRRERLARQRFDQDANRLSLQLRDLDEEMAALAAREREQRARVERRRGMLERLALAKDRGAIAGMELLRHEDELASMQQSLSRFLQEKSRLARERRGLAGNRERLAADLQLHVSELGSLRNDLRERIARNEAARVHGILAPVDGTIAMLDLVAGSTIRPAQLLAAVVPRRSSLAADLYVPSRAIGLVEEGQVVQLRYDAFPHERYGVAQGRVTSIDGFVSLPSDLPLSFGLREASYRVRVSLDAGHVRDAHGRYALRPGMTLAADIVLESRSLVDWLLSRFDLRF